MSRQGLENNRMRAVLLESAKLYVVENLAISANQTLVAGLPYLIGFDPASTGRNITMYTPTVQAFAHEHEIVNYSTGTGVLTILSPAAATIGTIPPGGRALVRWFNGAWQVFTAMSSGTGGQFNTVASQSTEQQYTLLASLANSQVMSMNIPFAFKLISVGFRTRIVASTGGKAATLTAQVNAVSVTGGVVSLTTANQNTSGLLTAGTAITAGNTGTAGQSIGVLVSAVTAFSEGDGYVEYVVQNQSLAA